MTTSPRPVPETVVADANTLYSHHQRNVLMTLGVERLFALRWTDRIEREWFGALRRSRPDLSPDRLRETMAKMNAAIPWAKIAGYEGFEAQTGRTHADDRHVDARVCLGGIRRRRRARGPSVRARLRRICASCACRVRTRS